MKIKDRLALYFTLISTITLLMVLCAVYFMFLKFMEADFFVRLRDRTMITAKLYLEADEITTDSLDKVRSQYLEKLNGEVIRIYNSKNTATFIGDDQQYWSNATINKVRKQKRLQFKDGKRQVVGIFYKDNQGDFVILASAIDKSTFYRLEKLRNIMAITFVIIFILLLLSGRWISKKILKPLDLFIDEVKQIKSSNLHFRVQEGKNKDEIYLLARNFNVLMEHLEQAFVLQKSFIANASHELRTPVTRIMMTSELSLAQDRTTKAYQEALTSVMEDAENMDKIISGLVNLAQADLEFGNQQLSAIRIDKLLVAIEQEWKRKGNKLSIFIDDHHDPERSFLILANATLLLIAINNIISNAFKFAEQQEVSCRLELSTTYITLSISDLGLGIKASVLPEIFKPFYSFSEKTPNTGNGMGLYMAHKIVTLFKGSLEAYNGKEQGATFLITLPKL